MDRDAALRKLEEIARVQVQLNNLTRDYQRLTGDLVHGSQFLQVVNGVFVGFISIATLNIQMAEEE